MSALNWRYRAFISYSQKDTAVARRLQRRLESYRLPNGFERSGDKSRRLGRFFRDDEDLAAAADLGATVRGAIEDSENLIVICSPNSASSKWVNAEILHFRDTGRGENVFAVIIDGKPNSGEPHTECFPPALRLAGSGATGAMPIEPLGIDLRKDSVARSYARLAAGLIDVRFDDLWKREHRRRRRRLLATAAGAMAAACVTGVVIATIDGATWRRAQTAHAADVASGGEALDAVPFALAGMPAKGDMLAFASEGAARQLQRTGAHLRIAAELGDQAYAAFSPDGRFVLLRDRDAEGALFEPATGAMIRLGILDASVVASFQGADKSVFSPHGRYLVMRTPDDEGTIHDLAGARADAIGPLDYFPDSVFSADERWLVTKDTDDNGTLRELPMGAVEPLGPIDDNAGVSFSPDSRYLLTKAKRPGGGDQLHDLTSGTTIGVGAFESFAFSPDGRYLLLTHGRDPSELRDLGTGQVISLGVLHELGNVFSPDSRHLLTRTPDRPGPSAAQDTPVASSEGTLRVLTSGAATPLGLVAEGQFSADGRFLLTREPWGPGKLRDLTTGEQIDLGDLANPSGFAFSPDSRFLVTRDRDGALRDLASGATTPLGQLEILGEPFSPDSRYLVTIANDGGATLRDLTAGTVSAIGPVTTHGFAFSADSRQLFTRAQAPNNQGTLRGLREGNVVPLGAMMDDDDFYSDAGVFLAGGRYLLTRVQPDAAATLLDLESGASVALGRVDLFSMPAAGGYLLTRAANDLWTLRDVAAPMASTDGERLRADVCASSADAIRPFASAVRVGDDAATAEIYAALRGRPWNPCDWRGIGAGREGWAQWWRRVEVVVLGRVERDYECGEIDAAGAIGATRVALCRVVGVPEERIAAADNTGEVAHDTPSSQGGR